MIDEDTNIVKSLPVIFVSVSHPSEAITKLIDRRQQDHAALLEILKEKIKKINEKTDEDIKSKSDDMKKKLNDVKEDVKQCFKDLFFKLQCLELEEDYYRKSKKKVTKFNQQELEIVNDYCNALRNIEESRQQEFKNVLKETKLKAIEIAHELPFMLDECFEKQIIEMNKITLSNYQHYAEVEKDLKLQVKNDLKLWMEELIELKETLKIRFQNLVKKSTLFVEEFLKHDSEAEDFASEVRRFNSLKSDFQFEMFGEDVQMVSPAQVERWLKEIQKWLAALDQSAKNIVQLYKSTITVLFHRYLGELDEIKKNMETGVVHSSQVEQYQCEIYTPTADQLDIQYPEDLQRVQEYWGDAIQEMTENINLTYSFLKGTTCLWDRHFVRIKELQILIMKDLDNTIRKNAASSDCHEASLNIVLEELRQGSNEKELDKTLENVKKILNKMEQAYVWEANSEIMVVMKYKTMMETGIDVLMTELKRFLAIHPPDYEKDPKKQRRRASQISNKEPDATLPIQILYCVFQVGAVKNWMFGLWEAIEQYIAACNQEIMTQVDNWINAQTEKIHERLKMKLMFHEPRYQHVKSANYEKRLKELLLHAKLYENHKNAAEEQKEELKNYRLEYDETCEHLCNDYIKECNEILEALPKTNNLYQAKCYTITMRDKLVPIEDRVKSLTDNYIDACTTFLEELKLYNYQFLNSARLFVEGGNFNMDEINDLYKDLKKLEDVSSKDVQNYIKEINTRFWRYTSRIQSVESNVTVTLSEIIKEHEHNENIVKKISKLQMDLREHVVPLKKTLNRIDRKIQKLSKEARNNLGKKEYLDTFVPQFQSIISDAVEICEYVYHPEPVDIFSLHNDKIASLLSGTKKVDYVDQLFNRHPDLELDDFISTMLKFCYNTSVDITTQAHQFYNTHNVTKLLLDSTKIQPTYEDCMDEVLRKFKPYLIQCEICWLEKAFNLLTILNTIKTFKEDFIVTFEASFYRDCMVNFELAVRNVMDQMKQEEEDLNEKLKQIYNRLKVLFGHPKNNEMLKQLQHDYDELHADNQAKFLEILNPRKEYLDNVFNETNIELEELRKALPVLKEDNKIIDLIEKLVLHIATKKTMLSVVISEIDESNQISMNKSTIEHIQSYFRISTEKLDLDDSPHSQVKATSLATLSTEKSYSSADEFLNILEDTLNTTKMKLEEFVEQKMIDSLENFKKIWNGDIRYILSLYRVKYDQDIF